MSYDPEASQEENDVIAPVPGPVEETQSGDNSPRVCRVRIPVEIKIPLEEESGSSEN